MFLSVGSTLPLVIQGGVDVDVDIGAGPLLGGGAAGVFVTTLVVGAILVALAPAYTESRMAAVVDDPVGTFVYGLLVLVALALLVFLLVISFVGILFAIPLVVAAYLAWQFGSAVAFLAIADRLLDREGDDWLVLLLVAAGLNGALVLSGAGALLGLAVGAAGFGAVVQDWLE